jgi:hypothetical protein
MTEQLKHQYRNLLLEELREGRIEPDTARAKAAEAEINLEERPVPSKFDPMTVERWTLPMAVAWIASKNPEQVREQWDPWRKEHKDFVREESSANGGKPPRYYLQRRGSAKLFDLLAQDAHHTEPVPIKHKPHCEARDELWRRLIVGEIVATGQSYPSGPEQEINRDLWINLWTPPRVDAEDILALIDSRIDSREWSKITVPSTEVLALWGEKPSSLGQFENAQYPTTLVPSRQVSKSELNSWFKQHKARGGSLTRDAIEKAGRARFGESASFSRLRALYKESAPHGGHKRGRKSAK